jgi:hypothetical protein
MSLDWGIGNCRDWEELKSDREWPVTQYLIFACMGVGLNGITEKNAVEFYVRLQLLEAINGTAEDPHTIRRITLEDVLRRIGLHTNVSPESRPAFLRRNLNGWFKEQEYLARRTLRKLDERTTEEVAS